VVPKGRSFLYDFRSENVFSIYGVQESYWDSFQSENPITILQGTIDFPEYNINETKIPAVILSNSITLNNETFSVRTYEENLYEFDILGWVNFDFENSIFSEDYRDEFSKNYFVLITLLPFMTDLEYPSLSLDIYIKPEIIDYNDIAQSIDKINNLVDRLNLKYGSYSFFSPIAFTLLTAQLIVGIFLVITLIFLLPFFFLAFYISKLSSELNLESRRVQYGIFLARGIRFRTIKYSYYSEGIIIGAINGIITFFLSPITGYLISLYLPVNSQPLTLEFLTNFYLTGYFQLAWSVVIGMALGFIIMRIPYYYSRLSPQELVHQYREEEQQTTQVHGRMDLAFLFIGLFPIGVGTALYMSYILNLPAIIFVIIWTAGSYSVYVIPFSPFLIAYGLSSIISRQEKLLTFIANFYSKITTQLAEVSSRMILSKMYRISRIVFVIALALTFIVFPLTISESLQHYQDDLHDYSVGADVRLDFSHNSSLTIESLDSHTNVESISLIQTVNFNYITAIFLDSQDYINTVDFESYWNIDSENFLSLANDECFITEIMKTKLDLDIDDFLTLNDSSYTIKGTFKGLGGTSVGTQIQNAVILNQMLPQSENTGSLLIKLKNASEESVITLKDFVTDIDSNIVFTSKIEILDPEESSEFDYINFLLILLEAQAVLLIFVALGGLSFIMIIRIRERTKEIGTWRSRGMSNKQLIQGVFIETITILTLGLIVGFITGFGLLFGFQGIVIETLFQSTSVIPINLIFPIILWILISVLVIGSLILSVFVGMWATLNPVSKQIRYEDYV
jgi:ABC-type antimicrobial peptide transport system permease subunit